MNQLKWRLALVATILVGAVLLPAGRSSAAPPDDAPRIRLVLQITVDQLRADLPRRVLDRVGEGGFRRLYRQGVVFDDAHHRHANTETVVGHATLATGADPAIHGMIGNVWYDRELGRTVYNIEDDRYRLLTAGAGVDRKSEIDPTQRKARSEGRSPSRMRVTTFADELFLFTGGRAKVFGVSVKDRGAVTMAGHTGKAYWFSKATGQFVTSTYYGKEYPDWVAAWNAKKPASRYAGKSWTLMRDRSTYLRGDADDRPYETELPGFGRVFPHPYGEADGKLYTTLLTLSPAGDELTLDFAKALIANEKLGQDDVPDYLSVSFSSTDYVGHIFGPSSLETEDNLLRLDRALAGLLAYVDETVGLGRTLVVLSADHGAAEIPEYLHEVGIPAGYFKLDQVRKEKAILALEKRFGVGAPLLTGYNHPYLTLDHEVIAKAGLDLATVTRAVAAELVALPGVAHAIPGVDLAEGRLPDTDLNRQVLRNHDPRRSGDIYVVFEPHWMINDFDGLEVASTHGSPWRYDTFVPIVFLGPGLPARRVYRRVETVDVAVTLAARLGTKPPSGATGRVLPEVLR